MIHSKNWSLNTILIVDACFQEFPKQHLDLAKEYAWFKLDFCLTQARFLLEHFCEYKRLSSNKRQDSCLSQALLLGQALCLTQALLLDSSKKLAWILSDLVNTGPEL